MQFTIANSRTSRTTGANRFLGSSNRRLWVAQGAMALLFLFAGVSKLVMPAEELTKNSDLTVEFLRFIGVCETLGAFGLILPGVLRIARGLTTLAAAGLVVIMVGAVVLTVAAEGVALAAMPLVAGLVCLYIVRGRAGWLGTARAGELAAA